MPDIRDLSLEFLCEFEVELASAQSPAYNLGSTPAGQRVAGGWKGGWVRGPRINGIVEPIGEDFAILRPDDTLVPDVRGIWRLDDGALVAIHYHGFISPFTTFMAYRQGQSVDPNEIQWTVSLRFETGDQRYDWLNRTLAVARGSVQAGAFRYRAFAVV